MIETRYDIIDFLPSFPPTKLIVAAFVAGPAIKKIKPAPGVIPFNISEAAMGMEPVAHTYIGMEIMSIIGYANNGFPK